MNETGEPTVAAPRRRIAFAVLPALVFGLMALVFAFALRTGDPAKLPSTLIGKTAPAMKLDPLEGLSENGAAVRGITPADLANGKPVVVNFWASWCAPCVAEHPLLIILGEKSGVPIYGVNYKDQAPGARRFLGRYGNPFAAVGVDPNGRAAIEWGVYGMPETFVLDGQGRIVYKHVGALTPEVIEQRILPAINNAK